MMYHQCRMEQHRDDGTKFVTVGWIEARGAKVGARIELKGEDGLWTVISSGGAGVEVEVLRAKQAQSHKGWASLVDA